MEGFDPITMSYLAGPMSLHHVSAADHNQQQLQLPMLDQLDQRSNYDAETFVK
jgi:hypothetical protein